MRLDRGFERRLAACRARLQLICVLGLCLLARSPHALAQATSARQEAGQEEYARVVEAAVEAYNRDDYATARRYFSRAHELRPSARTWRGLGTTAFELKLYDDAVRELTFALEDTRVALPANLRAETELTLRVARRRLADGDAPSAPVPKPELTASTSGARPEPDSGASPAPASATQPDPAGQEGAGLDGQRIAAIVAGGVGVVAIGLGVGFGLHSIAKGNDRDRLCPASEQALGCSPEAKRAADAAITAGNLSTVGWVIGGVGLASAVVLWLTATERSSSEASVSLGPGTLQVSTRF